MILVPDDYLGDVIGDVNSRRGTIEKLEARDGNHAVTAYVPLAEMFGYATELRSKTQGRGLFTMQSDHYAEVPKNLQEKLIKY